MDSEFEKVVEILTSQSKFQVKLGLSRIKEILNCFNNPHKKLKFVHVAGTNGKGSVCSVLANILKESGIKTGLYTSPHLVSYCERIKVNGMDIPSSNFVQLCKLVLKTSKLNSIELTEFEILTTIAFLYFEENNIDIVVFETGLGGRFDATNVIDDNLCSIITSISLDHTDRLGTTVEEIAFEKAGIIKKQPVIISTKNKGIEVIKKQAKELVESEDAVSIKFKNGKNILYYRDKKYNFPLLGLYQCENMSLVFTAIEYLRALGYKISETDIASGLAGVSWRCRMEYHEDKGLILDGAHNIDAAKQLKATLDYYFPNQKRIFIYGTLANKDYDNISKILFNEDDKIYFYEFDYPNALKFTEFHYKHAKSVSTIELAELARCLKPDTVCILCGSFYMLGSLIAQKIV